MRTLLISFLLLPLLSAQETVAPTVNEQVGPARGTNQGDYNIVQSWELGYRWHMIGGDDGKYRSDVNYRNGVRLLSSYLTINSKDGHGKFYDEIVLNTQGLGNDPYETVTLRVQKNKLYRYDMMWRMNDYFNPGLVTAGGLHLNNLTQRWQDHDIILFPQGKFKIKAGYSRNKEDGPALSSANLFDNQRGDIFTLFSNVKREFNSYRIGADIDYAGVRLSFLRRWEFYKEDTPYSLASPGAGFNPTDATVATGFQRAAPIHGDSPGWLVYLTTEKKKFAINGRFTYTGGNRAFVQNESALGTGLSGTNNRLVITLGDAKRPLTTGDLSVSFFATDKLTIINNTSVANSRIVGNSYFEQFDLGTLSTTVLNFQYLGVRLVTNSTDAHYHFSKKLDVFGGYRFADREIKSIQSLTDPATAFTNELFTQSNTLQAGVVGLNWIITGPLRLHLEAEVGRNDNPFTLVADRNYHALDGRLQYRKKTYSAAAGYRQNYNNNSITLTSFSSHARTYFANGSWAARDWLSFDAGYSRLHLDTLSGVSFFAGSPRARAGTATSVYISNIHAANLGVRLALKKRADLFLGYNITLDTGDGRSQLQTTGTTDSLFYNARTFPLSFQSPLLRLTIPITKKIKWNAGWQYYGYHEDFGLNSYLQNYHAHTGYTSVLWAF